MEKAVCQSNGQLTPGGSSQAWPAGMGVGGVLQRKQDQKRKMTDEQRWMGRKDGRNQDMEARDSVAGRI